MVLNPRVFTKYQPKLLFLRALISAPFSTLSFLSPFPLTNLHPNLKQSSKAQLRFNFLHVLWPMHVDSFCLIPSVYLSQHIFYIQLQLVSYLFKLFSLFQLDCKFLEGKSFVINSTVVTANEWVCLLFVILRSALFLHTKLFFFFKNFTWYYRKGGEEEISKSSLGDSIIAQQPPVLQNTSVSVFLI